MAAALPWAVSDAGGGVTWRATDAPATSDTAPCRPTQWPRCAQYLSETWRGSGFGPNHKQREFFQAVFAAQLEIRHQQLDGSLRAAVEKVGGELFTIVHRPDKAGALTH
jgi:hypothetical protein